MSIKKNRFEDISKLFFIGCSAGVAAVVGEAINKLLNEEGIGASIVSIILMFAAIFVATYLINILDKLTIIIEKLEHNEEQK